MHFMSRQPRIIYPNALYHLTVRGNEKKEIYFGDADRRLFLRILSSVIEKYHWVCHAYCLMNNHFHLLIQTPESNLSEGMRQLNGVYTQKINERYCRVGHIFQGRFKAFLIEEEIYLLTVARYIVLNPVRAMIVVLPEQYAWSSYRQTIGSDRKRKFLTTQGILSRFSSKGISAQYRYREFVHSGIFLSSPFLEAKHSILGSDRFILEVGLCEYLEDNSEFSKSNRFIGRPSLAEIFDGISDKDVRNEAIIGAITRCGYSQAQVARTLSLDASTIFRILKMHRFKT